MKLSLVSALCLSWTAAAAARKLHENKAVLSNGAEFLIDIQSPELDSTIDLAADQNATDLTVTGKVQIGSVDSRVAYIFIIDSSSSNNNESVADCGSISECTTQFFEALHSEVMADGSAEAIGVIAFNETAISVTDVQDPGRFSIEEAINRGPSDLDEDASCMTALEAAASMVYDSSRWIADTTVVVFAGDGKCRGSSNVTLAPEQGILYSPEKSVAVSSDVLGQTYAIVHSVALGEGRSCDGDDSFTEIPRNGGHCHSFSDPATPLEIMKDITATELTSLEIAIDDEWYRSLRSLDEIQVHLPQEGPVEIDFEVLAKNLSAGSHDICLRAAGKSRMGYLTYVEDCHRATLATPHWWPSDSEDTPSCTLDHELAQTTREITVDVGYNDVESGNFDITIRDPPYAPAGGSITTSGFCVDVGRTISKGRQYKMDVFSAFDPDIHTNAIDKPQYLPHLAWLINNYDAGDSYPASESCVGGEITWREMQGAVWKLVDDDGRHRASGRVDCISDGIFRDALNKGGGYEPDCLNPEERIPLVMVVDDDATGEILNQVIISQTFLSTIKGMCNCTQAAKAPRPDQPTDQPLPAAVVIGPTSSTTASLSELSPGSTKSPAAESSERPNVGGPEATVGSSETDTAASKATAGSVVWTEPRAMGGGSLRASKEFLLPVIGTVILLLVTALVTLKNYTFRKPARDEGHDSDSTDSHDSDSGGWDSAGWESGSNGWGFDDSSLGSSVGETGGMV